MSFQKVADSPAELEKMKKIEWFQEVLSLEPGSKVFFPLAKLFVETDQLEEAVVTLAKGLDRHPDFMEARLLYVQALGRLGRNEQAAEEAERIVRVIGDYPAFWENWAKSLPDDQRDVSVFIMLVASNIGGERITWTDVVLEGLNSLSERLVGPPLLKGGNVDVPISAKVVEEPAGETELISEPEPSTSKETGSLRTRTMASLLASQGDTRGALAIYRELLASAKSDAEKAELEGYIKVLESGPEEQAAGGSVAQDADPFGKHAKNRLIGTLEVLASRFEARARA